MPGSAPWSIHFAAGALGDLAEIVQYLLENDGPETAKELSALIRGDVKQRLMQLPLRGHPVPELQNIATGYHEIHVKSYRIIYQPVPENHTVRILLIARTHGALSKICYAAVCYSIPHPMAKWNSIMALAARMQTNFKISGTFSQLFYGAWALPS